jgi:hypothetical protein
LAFRKIIRDLGRLRRRNGASRWRLTSGRAAGHWVETTVYRSRAEFDRQPGRLTKADLDLQEQAKRFLAVSEPNPMRVAGENLWV